MTRHLRSQPQSLRDYAGLLAGMPRIWWRQRRLRQLEPHRHADPQHHR